MYQFFIIKNLHNNRTKIFPRIELVNAHKKHPKINGCHISHILFNKYANDNSTSKLGTGKNIVPILYANKKK